MNRLVRMAMSVVGLVTMVVGVPAALVGFVGWPLPQAWPSLEEVRIALEDGWRPGEEFVLGVLAILVWAIWAQLLRHVVAQLVAQRRARASGEPSPEVVTGRGVAPRVVGWLVGGLMASTPIIVPSAALAAEQPRIPVVLTESGALEDGLAAASPQTVPVSASSVEEAAPAYVVRTWDEHRDCLWNIAERYLGEGLRWGELLELNATAAQPSGRSLADDPQHWVYPGMELRLPADATGLGLESSPAIEPSSPAPPTSSVSPTAEAPAASDADATEAPAEEVDQGRAALVPTPARGQELATSTTTTASPGPDPQALPTPEPGQQLPLRGRAPAPARETVAPPPAAGVEDEAGSAPTVVLAGSGLLAAGVVLCLNRLRRVQQRRRRPGRGIRMPDAELVKTERSLRVGADEVGAEVVDVVLRSMAEAAGQLDQALPDVEAVELDQSSLRVVFAAPPPSPPEPWEAHGSERLWQLQLDDMDLDELQTLAGRFSAPLPALTSLGDRDGVQVLVNLEGTGVTEVVAEAGRAREVLAALALELTTCPWADFVDVVLVGFGDELEWLERARRVEALDDVVAALEREAYGLAELLDSSGWPNVVSARVQGAADDWVPTVVLCATDLDDDIEERLAKLSGEVRHAGVTVVVAGEVTEAQRRLVVDSDRVRMEPLGLYARRERWLGEDELQAVVALLEVASDTEDVAPWRPEGGQEAAGSLELLFEADAGELPQLDEDWSPGESDEEDWAGQERPVTGEPDEEAVRARANAGEVLDDLVYEKAGQAPRASSNGARPSPPVPTEAPRWLDPNTEAEVEVRVLGPIEVTRRSPQIRAKSLEAVVYLAMHRDGVDSDKLRWALWPDSPAKEGTWNTTGSIARTWLGEASDGTLLLPRSYHNRGLYQLDDRVSTDYQRFGAAVALAKRLDGPPAVALLRSALELVRGPLFDGVVGKWHWVKYEGHEAALEAQVVDAVLHMSALCLEAGDLEGATWAAHRGQRVSPYDERFTRVLMRSADLAGNPAGVDAAMEDICVKVEADVEPYDQVHPETLALYNELRRSRKTLAGSGRRR